MANWGFACNLVSERRVYLTGVESTKLLVSCPISVLVVIVVDAPATVIVTCLYSSTEDFWLGTHITQYPIRPEKLPVCPIFCVCEIELFITI